MTRVLHPIYVLDGPDCSGKSSLADAMVRQTGAAKLHLTYRFKSRMDLYHRWAIERAIKLSETQPVIIDRWWPSEIVYARAFRVRTSWPRNARAFDRIARFVDAKYIFCLPKNKDQYVHAWEMDRARRYAEKPWALKGRDEAKDNMRSVYELYEDVMTWMDAKNRLDVVQYDRFEFSGMVDKAAEIAVTSWHEWRIDPRKQLVIEPWLRRPGRHHVWPGATWESYQRAFDGFLEQHGVPDHKLEFMSVDWPQGGTVDKVTLMASLLSFINPAIVMDPSREALSRVWNATGNWPQAMDKLATFDEGAKNHLKKLGNEEIKNAARRLGLA